MYGYRLLFISYEYVTSINTCMLSECGEHKATGRISAENDPRPTDPL
jgi:hypothetical protein